jgi:beta-phosphoglucomutase-like phosphatase (HAD superfamily)
MQFSGYIFDVEGTLIDCVQQNLLSLQESLANFGVTVPFELLQLYSGLDGDQTLQIIAPAIGSDERKKVLETRAKIYEGKYLGTTKPFAGVRDVLEAIARMGGRIALATDCKGPELKHYRSLLDVDDLIACVACGDDVDHGKPDPSQLRKEARFPIVERALWIAGIKHSVELAVGHRPQRIHHGRPEFFERLHGRFASRQRATVRSR